MGSITEHFQAPQMWVVAECFDKDGNLKWRDEGYNTVMDEGANNLLDEYFAGSGYTATARAGLISSTGYTAIAAGDTMAQLAGTNGWREAGTAQQPEYGSPSLRKTLSWSAASGRSKATSAAAAFTFTTGGTVKGAFINMNGSASVDNTTGKLYNAKLFSGDRIVVATDVLNVSFTLSA